MLEAVKSFLKEQEWEFSKNEDSNVFIFGLGSNNGTFQCIIDIKEDNERIVVYSYCSSNCPKNKQKGMLKLLNYINYKIFFGSFEMDHEDGEIRFRTSVYFDNIKNPTSDFVESLVLPNIYAMDQNLPLIMGLIHGGLKPGEAIKSVEESISNQD
ncbi:MAG: YbjN domain-containing protein [Flavobacteriaceae bacterium]